MMYRLKIYFRIKSNGHINFEKYTSMAKLIKEILSWKTVPCTFNKNPSVFNAVQSLPVYTEEGMKLIFNMEIHYIYRLFYMFGVEMTRSSYGCEEPDGSIEKEHFNRLKKDQQGHRFTSLSKGNSPIQYMI